MTQGLDFQSNGNLVIEAKDNGIVEFKLDDTTRADIAKVETVVAGDGITVENGKTNSTGGKEFKVSLDDNYIQNQAKQAVKVVNGQNTSVTEGAEGDVKTYAVNVDLSGVAKNDLSNLTDGGKSELKNLAKSAVEVKATGLATVNKTTESDKEIYTVNVDEQGVTSVAKNAISVTGNADIAVSSSDNNGKKDFAVSLNKATQVAKDESKVVTAGAAYSAVTGAKTKVESSDDLIQLTKTESDDLTANQYGIAIDRNKLKEHFANNLNDTFAKQDAGNVDPKTWRDKLNVLDKTETTTAINNAGWTVKANSDAGKRINNNGEVNFKQGDNIIIERNENNITVKTVQAPTFTGTVTAGGLAVTQGKNIDMGNNQIHNIANGTVDTDAVNLSQLNALGNNQIKLAGNTGETDAQALNNTGGLNFGVKGTGNITSTASGSEVSVDLTQATKDEIAKKATVVAGSGITVDDSQTNTTGGKAFAVSVDDSYVKEQAKQAVKVVNGQNTSVIEGTEGDAKTYAVNVDLSGVAKNDLSNLTEGRKSELKNLAKLAVEVKATGLATVNKTTKNDKEIYTVNVDEQGVTSVAKNAISVTGNADIAVSSSDNNGKKDFAVSLNKATQVAKDESKAVTAGAAYSAVTGAKTKVESSDDLIQLIKTESDDLTANQYGIAIDRDKLKEHFANNLNDTFAKQDASNVDPKTWRDKLNVLDKTETETAINNAGWTVKANGDAGKRINNNDEVNFKQGDNILIERDENNITVKTVQNPTFTGTITANGGLSVGAGQAVNMGGNKIENIGNATADTDAVNLSQLNATKAALNNEISKGWNLTSSASTGGNASGISLENVNMGETVTIDAGKNINITQSAGNISFAVNDNPNFATVTTTDTATFGGRINANGGLEIASGQTVNMGSNQVKNVAKGTESTDAVNVQQLTESLTNSFWNLTSDAVGTGVDETETVLKDAEQINPNDQLKLQAGNNLKIKREANGTVTYSTKEDVVFNSMNSSSLNVSGMATLAALTVNGATRFNNSFSVAGGQTIDMGGNRIQNIADGVENSDAVNFQQLQSLANSLTEKGLNFRGNEGNTARNLGETLNIVGNAATEGDYSSNNVNTLVTEGRVEIQIAENPEFRNIEADSLTADQIIANSVRADTVDATSVTADNVRAQDITATNVTARNGSFESITTGGLSVQSNSTVNMGNNRVQGVGDAIEDYDAVNLRQLRETNAEVAKGWNISTSSSEGRVHGSSTEQMNMGEMLTIDAGKNIEITQKGNMISIATMRSANFGGKDESFSLEKGTSVNLGNNLIEGVEDGSIAVDSKQAVNGGQLYRVQQTANAGWNLSVNHSDSSNVRPSDTVDLNNRDSNIQIRKNGNDVTFDLAKDINLGKQGSINAGGVSIGNGSVNVGNVSLNANGVDLGGGKISNIGQGEVSETSNEAVTGSQLYTVTSFVNQGWELTTGTVSGSNGIAKNAEPAKVGLGNAVSVNAGQNIIITQNGKSIDIATSMTPTFNSLTINQGGTVDMGGNRVQNVAPAIKATDAVNYGQLKSELGRVDSRLRSGIEGAVASASLVQAFNPSEGVFAVGGGTYRGASAVSLGYSKVSDNGRVIFKLTGSANNYGDVMGGASIGFKF